MAGSLVAHTWSSMNAGNAAHFTATNAAGRAAANDAPTAARKRSVKPESVMPSEEEPNENTNPPIDSRY